jgi:anti-anti-sigma regulatory factor
VTQSAPITVGTFDGFTWIRCEGKGSFLNSPMIKSIGEQRIAAGERRIVVDLGACSGMDSTFMGTLAGIASKLPATDQGMALQIAEADERNRRSLEDLGLDFLMEIDPPSADWKHRLAAIRAELKTPPETGLPDRNERAKHMLDAHQQLGHIDEGNARRFKEVTQVLERRLSPPPEDPPHDAR